MKQSSFLLRKETQKQNDESDVNRVCVLMLVRTCRRLALMGVAVSGAVVASRYATRIIQADIDRSFAGN